MQAMTCPAIENGRKKQDKSLQGVLITCETLYVIILAFKNAILAQEYLDYDKSQIFQNDFDISKTRVQYLQFSIPFKSTISICLITFYVKDSY